MASLKDRFLYGASGRRAPKAERPRQQRGVVLKPFLKNFGTMIQYNLVSLLFFLPGIAWAGVNLILLSDQVAGATSISAWLKAACPVLSTWLMLMIPLWGVADIGACGSAGIFRRIIEGREISHWRDFSTAIRRNGLAAFLFGMLRGALWWMLLTVENFYSMLAEGGVPVFRILQVLGVVVFLGVLSVEALFIPAMQGTGGRWMDALRTAISQAIWHMPVCLSALALTVALPLALTLIPVVGVFIWGAYELVIGLSVRQYAFTAIAALLGVGCAEEAAEDDD